MARRKPPRTPANLPAPDNPPPALVDAGLLGDIRSLIEASRRQVAQFVNSAMVVTYWSVGDRIRRDIVGQERAEYGKQVIAQLATDLTLEYGSGFSRTNLFNMLRFAEVFPDFGIVQSLAGQLGWTHVSHLIYVEDPLAREFYARMSVAERWSARTLRQKIQGMLFERTAISRKPRSVVMQELEALRDEDRMSADLVFRDHYVLDFLGLKDTYGERDLEEAILRDIESFIRELGTDFTFAARQKRMTIDGVDYRLDLLFFHRRLRRLIAIDLKLGRFHAGDKGQMELYLRWLDKHDRHEGEEPPLGLILCAGKSQEHVELLELDKSSIRVAEYVTELPPMEVLGRKLHSAIAAARARIDVSPPELTLGEEDPQLPSGE
ncbi:PDDEXK nuclease domain-containing protein [Longimicrobium sp.]|uniref:PDDEXK nuclease domain-containing protein n=1 Tax=Longimicrobium sp. TaxID=2029185 RepID=UPI003B3B3A6F